MDCVLIGAYDVEFDALYRRSAPTAQRSAFVSYLQHNSVLLEGKRRTYSELLSEAERKASGRDVRLHVGNLPNLASCYLKSFLSQRGFAVEIVNFLPFDEDRLVALLADKPRAVALSTTLYLDPSPIVETVKLVRKHAPDACIIVGGPYVFNLCKSADTLTQQLIFKETGADVFVNDAQGEATLASVLERLRETRDLSGIPNVVWRSGAGWCKNERVIEDNDMDANTIDWSRFDPAYLRHTVQTRTARSCAFHCSFCSHPEMAGPLKLTSLPAVERELVAAREQGATQVVFIDDTFNVPLPRFKKLCRLMIEKRLGIRWFSYFRAGNADEETFDLMAEAGCAGVFLGVESGDQSVLKNMDKAAKVSAQANGIRQLRARGIVTFASFIIGFPGETDETVKNTIAFIEDTRPTFYRAEVWYADPSTPVMREAAQLGVRGAAFSWKHAGMDWRGASSWVETIYRSVTGSNVLPVYGFDFWSLPYLLGEGFDLTYLERFTGHARDMMLASMTEGGSADRLMENLVATTRQRIGRAAATARGDG